MNLNNEESNVIQLVKSLEDAERMKRNINASLKDSNEALGKANFITRISQRKSLQQWAQNKERCEQDLLDYDIQINGITEKINEFGYNSKDINEIKNALRPGSGFFYHLEQDHPWVKLLDEQEKSNLLIEAATGRYEGYSSLMSISDYINSFDMDTEKLDFIHGFLPDFKAEGKQTDAYKIGALFYDSGFSYGIDLEKAIQEYAPIYRHDLKFVSLVNDLRYEEDCQAIILEDLKEPLGAGCSPEDFKYFYDEIVQNHMQNQEKSTEQLKGFDDRISSILKKLNTYEFYGKIDFLGLDHQRNTIVGETLYYDNYKDYKKEIDESYDCGRPIKARSIPKEEYISFADTKEIVKNQSERPTKTSERLEKFRNNAGKRDMGKELTV